MPSGRFTNILCLRSSRSMLLGINIRSRSPVFETPTCFISFFFLTPKSDSFFPVIPLCEQVFFVVFLNAERAHSVDFLDDEKLLVIAHRWRSRGMSPLTSPPFGGSGEGYTQTSATTIMALRASSRWKSFGLHLHGDPLVTWARNHRKVLSHLSLMV
jgi:hypothetical protein